MQGCYERNTLKTSTFIRICDAQKLRYVVEEKKTNICIYFVFFETFYIHFVFVHCAESGNFAWFSVGDFFEGGGSTASLPIFWAICPRVCGDGAFPGDFPVGSCVKFFYFLQWLSLSFVFTSMFVICLFVYYYHHYLVGVN